MLYVQSFKQESVGWDLRPEVTDIVLWQYINPQRTHESFHCPLPVEGQLESCYRTALPARVPQGSSAGKTFAIMGDWTWTFPNHYISQLPVDQFKQDHLLVRMWQLKLSIYAVFSMSFFFFSFLFPISSHPVQNNGSFTQIETCCLLAGASFLRSASCIGVIAREASALRETV